MVIHREGRSSYERGFFGLLGSLLDFWRLGRQANLKRIFGVKSEERQTTPKTPFSIFRFTDISSGQISSTTSFPSCQSPVNRNHVESIFPAVRSKRPRRILRIRYRGPFPGPVELNFSSSSSWSIVWTRGHRYTTLHTSQWRLNVSLFPLNVDATL